MLRYPKLTFDRQAVEMAAVFAVVLLPVAYIAMHLGPETASAVDTPGGLSNDAGGQATAGAGLALFEVAFAATLLAGYIVYRRYFPEWLQDTARTAAFGVLFIYAGARFGMWVAPGFAGLYVTMNVLDELGVWWLANNALAIVLAIGYAIVLGALFGVVGLAVLLVGMTVYDHVFANKKGWMFALATPLLKARLPVLFIRPGAWRFPWDDVVDSLDSDGEKDENQRAWGIGMADLMLPSAFVAAVLMTPASAAYAGGIAVAALCIAGVLVACARLRFEMLTQGSGAGLPALTGGVLAPYAVATLVVLVV
jgi:presenilin-like A22 family membrane protease